ncbi:BNR repeat-containing protein [bacterium]|nr:BNR repeat-containing protein [bacterium]
MIQKTGVLCLGALLLAAPVRSQIGKTAAVTCVPVSEGWAQNSVNTVIFRRNSIVSRDTVQTVAFYDSGAHVILARRTLNQDRWIVRNTGFQGNIRDAHNSISIMTDGDGCLHMAWNHHNTPLNYCRNFSPDSLIPGAPEAMTGILEQAVSYPEFYIFPDGDLIFLYRDGASGRGNLVMNYFDTGNRTWTRLHDNLIDGERQRSAYWQAAVDEKGGLHLSWVWRETWDVASNHDLCYAFSADRGRTWMKSTGESYTLPITASTAEYALLIPQESELINQTSMCADTAGRPAICTYWAPAGTGIPQFHLVFHDGGSWQVRRITDRRSPFSLSGGGTKRIPVSRPQILCDRENRLIMIYRDAEHGDRVSAAATDDPDRTVWTRTDLTEFSVGQWEPSLDTEIWRRDNRVHLFVQNTGQGDAETLEPMPAQMIYVLEWEPRF